MQSFFGRDAGELVELLENLALKAGQRILMLRRHGLAVREKADNSPVTLADQQAEDLIREGLQSCFPGLPLIAEEAASQGKIPSRTGEFLALIDPLDGTRELIAGRDEFTVNIGLVAEGRPEIGVVYAPALGKLYSGRPGLAECVLVGPDGEIIERSAIHVRQPGDGLRILASRSHRNAETERYLARFADAEIVCTGSSLKFCLLAEGEADLYPRLGPTMQWDTAAGDAVLRAAGGMTCTLDGQPLTYGRRSEPDLPDFGNPAFIAQGGQRG